MTNQEEFDNLYRTMVLLPEMLTRQRKLRNLTQDQVADKAGISRSTLSLAERGETTTTGSIRKYLRALKGHDMTQGTKDIISPKGNIEI